MCGICGIIDYNLNKSINRDILQRACTAMEHRGPDEEGIYLSQRPGPGAGLGHRRLKIIDLTSAGHQPMCNEDKTIWLVFNGEIYNFKELRKELEIKGHKFNSQTDTETLIHLYEDYGQDCLKFLRGMFAFAIWDENKQMLFLARDRVGKKPLLYYYANGIFCFASEFLALLAMDQIKKMVDFEAIHHYLTFGYIPAPLTIYKNVFKLLPAHYLILKNQKITLEQYWRLDYLPKINISENEAIGEILRLLKEATRLRLYSDVPLGAFLSGGIDSSTVVALMSELSDKKVKTFSIGFKEADYNELKYAGNIAKRFSTEHHELIVKPDTIKILPLLVERYGEPYADSSCIPTYYVAQQTRRYVTVALNGDGGDELFAGYERHQAMLLAHYYQQIPAFGQRLIQRFTSVFPDSVNPQNKIRKIKRFLNAANLPYLERYMKWISIFDVASQNNLYSRHFSAQITHAGPANFIRPFLNNSLDTSLLDAILRTDTLTYLPNDLLVKIDIASMANSLEARSPFLDHKLMEFVAKLPQEYKMKRLIKKYILKKAIRSFIPAQNIYRRKMGFGLPIGAWFRNELKEYLYENLLSEKSLKRGYFNPTCIKDMVTKHTQAKADYTFQLWALLMLELWHQRFLD